MSHRNAPPTPTGRLRLARCVMYDGWPLRRAAERFQVSHPTAARWASPLPPTGSGRDAGPLQPPAPPTIAHPGRRRGPGRPAAAGAPDRAGATGRPAPVSPPPPPSSGTACPLWQPPTGPPESRSAATNAPGPANWCTSTSRYSAASLTAPDTPTCTPPWTTTPAWPHRAPARREGRHLRGLPTTGNCLVRHPGRHRRAGPDRQRLGLHQNTWRDTCRDLGISPHWTRPWRPQTNGKVQRFHRTLLAEWAYTSDAQRQQRFPTGWTGTTTRSTAKHQPPASPTSPNSTPRTARAEISAPNAGNPMRALAARSLGAGRTRRTGGKQSNRLTPGGMGDDEQAGRVFRCGDQGLDAS